MINFSFINTKKVRNSEMLSSIRNRKNLFEAYMVEKSGRANGFN